MCSQGHENGTQPQQSQVIPYVVCGTASMASSYFWFITACSKLDCPVICQKYRCLSGAQYNAVRAKGSCDASPVEATPSVMGFFPKICVSVSIPGMGMGTGRSLAVVCCWWGQRERGEHEGEEVAAHGAIPALAATPSRDRGWSLFWCLCWTRESIPSCVCLCECQKPHPEGSSEPLGDLSSHPLPPCGSSCRSWVSLDPLAANSTSADHFSVLAHRHALCPSELKGQPTPDPPGVCMSCFGAAESMQDRQGAEEQGHWTSAHRFWHQHLQVPMASLSPLRCRSGSLRKVLDN